MADIKASVSALYPLALKTSALCTEPLAANGGTMFSLNKTRGVTGSAKSWIGILLSSCVGQTIRRCMRLALPQEVISHLGQMQCGGMPHRCTDFASQLLRLRHKQHVVIHHCNGSLFQNVRNVFYSVVRCFCIDVLPEDNEEHIASVLDTLGIPVGAAEHLAHELPQLAELASHVLVV